MARCPTILFSPKKTLFFLLTMCFILKLEQHKRFKGRLSEVEKKPTANQAGAGMTTPAPRIRTCFKVYYTTANKYARVPSLDSFGIAVIHSFISPST